MWRGTEAQRGGMGQGNAGQKRFRDREYDMITDTEITDEEQNSRPNRRPNRPHSSPHAHGSKVNRSGKVKSQVKSC